jgi:hypothetical protein
MFIETTLWLTGSSSQPLSLAEVSAIFGLTTAVSTVLIICVTSTCLWCALVTAPHVCNSKRAQMEVISKCLHIAYSCHRMASQIT